MTDRELLEAAAKAVGLVLDYRRGSDAYYYDDPETGREEWNPLSRDGQALRLAVKVGLTLDRTTNRCWAFEAGRSLNGVSEEFYGSDPYAATRRAIVRAAAEIGKAMP